MHRRSILISLSPIHTCRLPPGRRNWTNASTASEVMKINFIQKLKEPSRAQHIAISEPSQHLQLTYEKLDVESTKLAHALSGIVGNSETIGVLNKPSIPFVVSLLATWKLGKVFVPMCTTHSANELEHVITDSNIKTVLMSGENDLSPEIRSKLPTTFVQTPQLLKSFSSTTDILVRDNLNPSDNALIMYTSGTTGRPKGVVHTHSNIHHMMDSLNQAWQYEPSDKILHFLPLYHMHGLLNKLLCVLNVGGSVEFSPSASPNIIWQRLAADAENRSDPLTMFMAVPTVYAKMLECASTLDPSTKIKAIQTMKKMRLMACGSAALPDIVMDNWKKLTGQTLLERYGMTEIGMALSNPYTGEKRKGHVGFPLPYVKCRIVDEHENPIAQPNSPGELYISGPCVFKHYLNNEKATKESFSNEWFKTGDIAEITEDGYFKILGRNSSDIIKASGYKISALEIERELLSHPDIIEAAVVGVPDVLQGEIIVCVVSFRKTPENVKKDMDEYLADKLAKYKIPKQYFLVPAIPRNHLGKVNKKTLIKDLGIAL